MIAILVAICNLDWPKPTSVKALRGFLGLAGYYRRLVRNFRLIAKPPNPHLDTHFSFAAFSQLEHAVTTAAELALPDFSEPFTVCYQVLHVKVRHDEDDFAGEEEADSWMDNLDDDINCSFPNLRLVEITYFSGCKAELDFIRSLLLNSPVLETMTVRAFSADGSSEVLKKLLQLRRTSNAEIIYLDP